LDDVSQSILIERSESDWLSTRVTVTTLLGIKTNRGECITSAADYVLLALTTRIPTHLPEEVGGISTHFSN
jgi:hypothetical protein